MKRRRLHRGTGDARGAVAIEAALIVPLLTLFAIGALELAVAWHTSNQVKGSVRAAVLVAARADDDARADLLVLQNVAAGLDADDELRWVMVFRAVDGEPTAACRAAAAALESGTTGVTGDCNIYAGSFVANLDPTEFQDPDYAARPDRWLCPLERTADFGPAERIGVGVHVERDWITGILPGGAQTIEDHAVAVAWAGG